jgi:DNA-directed RNA polymerase
MGDKMKIQYTQEELAKIQVEKEIAMKTAGVERFYRNNERENNSDTDWNRRIIQELVVPFSDAIDTYLDYYTGRRGKPSKTLTYLKSLPSKQSAFITIKNIIDCLTRETEIPVVAKTIGQRIEDQVRFSNVENNSPKYVERIQKQIRRARSKQYSKKKKTFSAAERNLIAGKPEKGFKPSPELAWKSWPEQDLMQLGSKLIDIFHDNILFEGEPIIKKRVLINGKNNKAFLEPTDHIEGWIDKYKEVMEVMSPTFAPCVIPPKDWTTPTNGGYHIPEISETLPLIKCRQTQLRRLTRKQMPAVYDAINTLQNVEWTINDRVYDVLQDCIRLNLTLGIPDREPYEIPEAPIPAEFKELKGNELKEALSEEQYSEFINWKMEANKIYSLNQQRKADYKKLLRLNGSASQYKDFEKIYFVYSMDFRGRVYCKSDSVSPQGDDVQKGLLNFAKGKALGKTGYKWLAVHGANVWGEDKIPFDARVKYIEDMSEVIRDIATDPLSYKDWAGADKPWQFLNFCFEWSDLMDWIEDGNKAEDFISHLPIAMDGSCSGIQHYSAILRDPVAGAAVNLVPDTYQHDIYGDVAKVAKVEFERLVTEGETELEKEAAQGWLDIKDGISRSLCKKPVMTLPYGSTQIRCLDTTSQYLTDLQSKEDMEAKAQGRKPVKVHPFTANRADKSILRFEAEKVASKVIWKSIGKVVTSARDGMKFIQTVAKKVASLEKHLEWITPTGFIVEQREYDYKSRKVKTQLLGNTYFSIKEEKPELDKSKMKLASAPNFIHSLDASHLILAVNSFKKHGIDDIAVIHDSFGTYACDTEVLRDCLRETLVDMYEENDVLQDFKEYNECRILEPIDVEVPERMGLDLNEVKKSEYCFA